MSTVSVRELRNNGGAVLDRVARGEVVVVTRDGAEVAELHPRERPGLSAAEQAEVSIALLAFDVATARALGRVAAALRTAGRKPSARGFDALSAAVAISRAIPFYTCNPADVAMIDDLDLRPMPQPDQSIDLTRPISPSRPVR